MNHSSIIRASALEYVRGVTSGEFTAEEFLSETLSHIEEAEARYNAYLHVEDGQKLLARAREIDRGIKSGQKVGLLAGMPVSIKDNICMRGSRTTCGSRMLEGFVAPYDATAVSRLHAEGGIIVAKANMDEFAMGLTTEFSAYGPSRNPWNTGYVPGGSSGGSAAATAAFECVASLGSDTGGSVRNPASFCSVVGYKPTYGLVSRHGLVSYANSIEQIGPIARTVSDAALVLGVIAGRDEHDDTTADAAAADCGYLEGIEGGIEGMRVGIVDEMTEGADPEVARAVERASKDLEAAGASCERISLDMVGYSVPSYYTITAAEAASNLARYDNLRYGYDLSVDGYEFNSYVAEARCRFGPEVTRRMILGGYVSSAGHAGRYYLKALKVRAKLTREVADAFASSYDILMAPTVPILPFRIGEKSDDPVSLFMVDLNTVTANLTRRPAVSVPYAVSAGGLPIGVQMMADSMQDKTLLRAARALEKRRAPLPEVPD